MSGFKRSIKSVQPSLREMSLQINGTLATPTATGFDQYGVSSVVDSTNGLLTIIFKRPFERACQVKGIVPITADTRHEVVAVDFDRVTVQCTDLAGVDAVGDYYITILGSDSRFDV